MDRVRELLDRAGRDLGFRANVLERVGLHECREVVQSCGVSIDEFLIDPAAFDQQARQFAEMGAKVREPTTAIKLAFGHHGVWSVGPHGGKRGLVDLDKLLRETGVKAWVHGHDHCLFHIQQGAMHYVCSGAGSKVLAKHNQPGACPIANRCAELGPVEELAYLAKNPGGPNHIDGGFALFEIGAASGKFTFFDQQARAAYSAPLY